jgi:hypothetical protein
MAEQHTTNHADDSVHQSGAGPNINIVLDRDSVERAAGMIQRSAIVNGIALALCVIMAFLFWRLEAQSALQTYQFNLLRSCLQSSQCDASKVLPPPTKEK